MSQFDWPKINFSGKGVINPATANNNSTFPLAIYDPVQVKALLPPRLYLTAMQLDLLVSRQLALPSDVSIQWDEYGHPYVTLAGVNTEARFKQWVITPLGDCAYDRELHAVYEQVHTFKEGRPLKGAIPAGWNYYGGMEFNFLDVRVTGVELQGLCTGCMLYTQGTANCPDDVALFLGAAVQLGEPTKGKPAVMIDVITTHALYSQVFGDVFQINTGQDVLMRGKPGKASLRFLNPHRILNQVGTIAGSGTFYCTMPIEDLEQGEDAPVMRFMRQHHTGFGRLAGVSIRYNLFEVKQKRNPDYSQQPVLRNPATCTLVGSITPWYAHELQAFPSGRQLVPQTCLVDQKKLPPCMYGIAPQQQVLVIDLLNSIPERVHNSPDGWVYESCSIGELVICCRTDSGIEVEIGKIEIGEWGISRKDLFASGGIFRLYYGNHPVVNTALLEAGSLVVYGYQFQGMVKERVLLLKEAVYVIASDQAGVYVEQDEAPEHGARSSSGRKELCRISIFHKGRRVTTPIPMTIVALKTHSISPIPVVETIVENAAFADGQTVLLPTDKIGTAMFVFYPGIHTSQLPHPLQHILDTGFFVSMRVLPRQRNDILTQSANQNNGQLVSFNWVYKEVLEVFELIYPYSAILTPFEEDYFRLGWNYIKRRLSPELWHSSQYMPSTRDLSKIRLQLLHTWAQQTVHAEKDKEGE